jgi:PAS domain S-box-containing protein
MTMKVTDPRQLDMLIAGLNLLDQGVTVFDADLKLIVWNEPFLRLLDFPPDLAEVGVHFERFIRYNVERGEYGPGDPEQQVAERVAAARDFRAHSTERQRPNGRILRMLGAPLPHQGFITLYSDITAQRAQELVIQRQNAELEERVRRRTEQLENANAGLLSLSAENERTAAALQRSEARIRLITDTIPALIGYFDSKHVYQYANKGYSDWFGVPEREIPGRPIPTVIGDDIYAIVRPHVDRALAGSTVTYEYAMERRGRMLHARSTLVPEIGPDGTVLGCFVFSYDISDQKRLQAALVQAQRMEAIGQLTGGLAHDFNNLLTVMIGNLGPLQESRPEDPDMAEFVEPALRAARRGERLIQRLLSFSRRQALEPRAVDVVQVVTGMMKLIRRSLPESIAVETAFTETALSVWADAAQLENAVLNFALNARDAMPDGGRLRFSGDRIAVFGEVAESNDIAPGHYVRLTVDDTGCGMDEATRAQVFEPFFTTKRADLGGGLGLSMVHRFVRESGGAIRIDSTVGLGTTITVLLPVAPADAPEDIDAIDEAPHGVADRPLVLLVEDNAEVRRVIRMQLNRLGHPVVEAENGPQAIGMLEQIEGIGVVLTDLLMPGGMSGRDVAAKAGDLRPGIPVIMMSGHAQDPAAGGPALRVLQKPIDAVSLRRTLAEVLNAGMVAAKTNP